MYVRVLGRSFPGRFIKRVPYIWHQPGSINFGRRGQCQQQVLTTCIDESCLELRPHVFAPDTFYEDPWCPGWKVLGQAMEFGHLSKGSPTFLFFGRPESTMGPHGCEKTQTQKKRDDSPKYSKDLLQLVMKFRRNKYTVMVTCVSFLYIRQMHLACTNLELRWIYTNLIKNL